jgi:spore maturation protein SpmA
MENVYTQVTSKIGFLAMRKLSRFNDQKMTHINNMGHFLIVEARGFGVVRKPIFEITCVYNLNFY